MQKEFRDYISGGGSCSGAAQLSSGIIFQTQNILHKEEELFSIQNLMIWNFYDYNFLLML